GGLQADARICQSGSQADARICQGGSQADAPAAAAPSSRKQRRQPARQAPPLTTPPPRPPPPPPPNIDWAAFRDAVENPMRYLPLRIPDQLVPGAVILFKAPPAKSVSDYALACVAAFDRRRRRVYLLLGGSPPDVVPLSMHVAALLQTRLVAAVAT
uniref:PseudoU_synth_2 domain-containing protein n=1 Tax=Macrostomum lignano TaxID=282301 RepID=A0A1I8HW05_9PLAT